MTVVGIPKFVRSHQRGNDKEKAPTSWESTYKLCRGAEI
jgi:hypothetical protein